MAKNGEEIERRFLVLSIDPDYKRGTKPIDIWQGYLGTRSSDTLRVRISDKREAELTFKTGEGLVRGETTQKVSATFARGVLEACQYKLHKTRYKRDGWEVDEYDGRLTGLIIAEFEMKSPDEPVELPPWIKEAKEVTDSLTNLHLARLAADLAADAGRPVREMLLRRVPRIVLTGGPCSGKSTLMEHFRRHFGDRIHCVPEVATIIIGQVGITPPAGNGPDPRRFQRILGQVQQGFEDISNDQAVRDGKHALLLDRGLMDSAAYLPDGATGLVEILGLSREHIFGRYDLVLSLGPPPALVYAEQKANNPARHETYGEAMSRAAQTREVWCTHPNFLAIDCERMEDKLAAVEHAIKRVLASA